MGCLCHIFSGSKGRHADLGGNGLIVVASVFLFLGLEQQITLPGDQKQYAHGRHF